MKRIIDIDDEMYKRICEAQSVPDMYGTDIVNAINIVKKSTPVSADGDLISKQDAIDALEEYLDYLQKLDKNENPTAEYKWYGVNWARNTIADIEPVDVETQLLGAELHGIKIGYEEAQKKMIKLDLAKKVIAKFKGYLDEDMIYRIQIALEKEKENGRN